MSSLHAFSRPTISRSSSSSCRCWDCLKKQNRYRIRSPNRCCRIAFQLEDRPRRLLAHTPNKTEHDFSVAAPVPQRDRSQGGGGCGLKSVTQFSVSPRFLLLQMTVTDSPRAVYPLTAQHRGLARW